MAARHFWFGRRRPAVALSIAVTLATLLGAVAAPGVAVADEPSAPAAVPTVTSLSPTKGLAVGGTTVTITGTGFTGATGVRFGATNPATSFTVVSDTQITVVAPPPPVPPAPKTTVNVFVDTPDGSSASAQASWFRYLAPPTITAMTPSTSSYEGGQRIVLTVADLDTDWSLEVDGAPVYAYAMTGDPMGVRFTAPAHAAGTADVTVSNAGGTSAPVPLTYLAAPLPRVTSITPDHGPVTGGTVVELIGTGFTGATQVFFDDSSHVAPAFTVHSDTHITATTPAVPEFGDLAVKVTTPAGTTPAGSCCDAFRRFTFEGPPVLWEVTPANGPTFGGTTVEITGRGFADATGVRFGTTSATSWTMHSDRTITAVTPPHAAGEVTVSVESALGWSTSPIIFEYTDSGPPTVEVLTPRRGPTAGGNTVVITGSGFTGATEVRFGKYAVAPSFTVDSDTQITVVAPADSGGLPVNVWVTTPAGTNANLTTSWYSYIPPPYVTSILPQAGPSTGGTSVRIGVSYAIDVTAVRFGGVPATSFHLGGDGYLYATAPPHAIGSATIVVETAYGTSTPNASSTFTYIAPDVPVLTARTPSSGSTIGGTTVTITGVDLDHTTGVRFGTTPAASFTVVSPTQVVATSPPHAAGQVALVLESAAGDSPPTTGSTFTFTPQPAPYVSGLSPDRGTEAGGTTVTIYGSAFTGATSVQFGLGRQAASFTVVSDTQITAVTPPAATPNTSVVNVFVTTPIGTSTTNYSTTYFYNGPPTVTAVAPTSGPAAGGTTVTITGTRLGATTEVWFGGVPATSFSFVSTTTLTAVAPPLSPGDVPVTVETIHGTSPPTPAAVFRALGVPRVNQLSPSTGDRTGGTVVTVRGAHLAGATEVRFGATPATSVTPIDDQTLIAVAPAGAVGAAVVTVTTPGGTSAPSLGAVFTAVEPGAPTVTRLTPNHGTVLGGGSVVVTGAGFTGATSVRFGWGGAASFTVVSDTELVVQVPPRASAALVNVFVQSPAGTSANGPASWYRYDPA